MFNQIQGSLWPEFTRRFFGGARSAIVSPEIGVNVDLFSRPELWALHGGSLMWGLLDGLGAGGAGFRSQVALSMVPATRSLFVLERLILSSTTAESLFLGWSSTDLTSSTGNLVGRDTRRFTTTGGSAPATARIRTQNNAALANLATNTAAVVVAVNGTVILDLDAVIGPGWSLRVFASADNLAIVSRLTFIGRERSCTPDELAVL